MQLDINAHYAVTNPGLVQVLGVDLWNGTAAQLGQFKVQTGATYPLALLGASVTGGNVEALYGTYDNYMVLDSHGVVRYHAALAWPHGNRYHLNEIRAVVDSLVNALLDAPAGAPQRLSLSAGPVPSSGPVRVVLELPRAASDARVCVLDIAGREVASLHEGPLPAGRREWVWDGRDAHGAALPAGMFAVRATAGAETRTLKLVRTR